MPLTPPPTGMDFPGRSTNYWALEHCPHAFFGLLSTKESTWKNIYTLPATDSPNKVALNSSQSGDCRKIKCKNQGTCYWQTALHPQPKAFCHRWSLYQQDQTYHVQEDNLLLTSVQQLATLAFSPCPLNGCASRPSHCREFHQSITNDLAQT